MKDLPNDYYKPKDFGITDVIVTDDADNTVNTYNSTSGSIKDNNLEVGDGLSPIIKVNNEGDITIFTNHAAFTHEDTTYTVIVNFIVTDSNSGASDSGTTEFKVESEAQNKNQREMLRPNSPML